MHDLNQLRFYWILVLLYNDVLDTAVSIHIKGQTVSARMIEWGASPVPTLAQAYLARTSAWHCWSVHAPWSFPMVCDGLQWPPLSAFKCGNSIFAICGWRKLEAAELFTEFLAASAVLQLYLSWAFACQITLALHWCAKAKQAALPNLTKHLPLQFAKVWSLVLSKLSCKVMIVLGWVCFV